MNRLRRESVKSQASRLEVLQSKPTAAAALVLLAISKRFPSSMVICRTTVHSGGVRHWSEISAQVLQLPHIHHAPDAIALLHVRKRLVDAGEVF